MLVQQIHQSPLLEIYTTGLGFVGNDLSLTISSRLFNEFHVCLCA